MSKRVNFCRAISQNGRLLYPTKLPRRPRHRSSYGPFAIVFSVAELALLDVVMRQVLGDIGFNRRCRRQIRLGALMIFGPHFCQTSTV